MSKKEGPYLILTLRSPVTYEIADPAHPDQALGTYHVSAIKDYQEPETERNTGFVALLRKRGRPKNPDGKPKLYGIEAELIKSIMTKIGVDYEIVTPEDGQYGIELSSGNWTGVIGMLYRREADIGIANLEDRFRTVEFSSPYISEGLYFSYVKSANREQLFSFLRMFDFSTWMLFSASYLLASVVVRIILKDQETISSIMLYLFGSFLRQTVMFHREINKWKLIFFSWLMFAFIMSSVYSGALSSFLVLPSEAKIVENFRELSEAVANVSIEPIL
ncbi:glutamate receptor ionotropic, delta-1 [Trichonephila clavipes]|nr:glutamate receptor ionotropic, delta-1 [Trichonephila clavipes]